jgi:hypothetical protein
MKLTSSVCPHISRYLLRPPCVAAWVSSLDLRGVNFQVVWSLPQKVIVIVLIGFVVGLTVAVVYLARVEQPDCHLDRQGDVVCTDCDIDQDGNLVCEGP